MAGSSRTVLDGADLRRWALLVADRLAGARSELDALNVFPVPDGDTGTNLALTVGGAVADGGTDPARSVLVHARGSSGVIASQLVRGWADVLTGPRRDAGAGPDLVAQALRRGDDAAWAAVADPREGTVLSVSRAAAGAAERAAAAGADLAAVLDAVVAAAQEALARTPGQLPALGAAGVVDAGGAGLLLALRALREVVGGDADGPAASSGVPSAPGALSGLGVAGVDLDPDGPAYEVMYLLHVGQDGGEDLDGRAGRAVGALEGALQALGDSVLVVGGGGLWHVHVHTDDPGAAVEAGIAAGRPAAVRITHFAAAAAAARAAAGTAAAPREATAPGPAPGAGLAVVAFAAGEGTAALCRAAGATVVPADPADRLLDAMRSAAAGGRRVLVLPHDQAGAALAERAAAVARQEGLRVVVAGSRAQVQVLAALAVLGGGPDDDAVLRSVAAAVEGCRPGAVTVAGRAVETAAGPCRAGELLGTAGEVVVAVGSDPVEVAAAVVAGLGEGTELVTVLPGRGGEQAAAALARRLLAEGRVAVDVVGGGQPGPLLLLGGE